MSNAPYMYVLIFIGFMVAVYLLKKFNQGVIDNGVATAKAASKMPELAQVLGLKYEDTSMQEKDKKTIMDTGERISGEYEGMALEIVMANNTQHMDGKDVPFGYTQGFTSKTQKTIKLTVSNPDKKKFHISPKSSHVVAAPTGNGSFDGKLMLTGDKIVSDALLGEFGDMGWMDLKLEGNTLLFNDSFYEQFTGLNAMKMMSTTHPIWRTSATNWSIDVHAVKAFIDKLVDFAKKEKLV